MIMKPENSMIGDRACTTSPTYWRTLLYVILF